jgi:hypothetical protein
MKKISLLFFHKYLIYLLVACRLSLLSQVCAICTPSRVNVRRPVEQIVGVQSWNCNHVSATEWNHKSGCRRLRPPFSHTAAVVRVCIHSVCASSCAKDRLASNCRPAILTSRSISCHYFYIIFILYRNIKIFIYCLLFLIILLIIKLLNYKIKKKYKIANYNEYFYNL